MGNRLPPQVFVVDDDEAVLRALLRVLRGEGWAAEGYATAEAFLAALSPLATGCLLLDVELPGLTGLELQRRLREASVALPIVFLTGHGDISMTVQAVKAGASDFLTKPVKADALIAAVRSAIRDAPPQGADPAVMGQLESRLASLTAREREVLQGVVAGKLNKQIASDLHVVEQTVKFHRGHLMDKMHAKSAADLIYMAARLGIGATH